MEHWKNFESYGHYVEILPGAYKKYSPWHLKEIDFDAANVYLTKRHYDAHPYVYVRLDGVDIYRLKNLDAEEFFFRMVDTLLMEKNVGIYGNSSSAFESFLSSIHFDFEKIETIQETKARLGLI